MEKLTVVVDSNTTADYFICHRVLVVRPTAYESCNRRYPAAPLSDPIYISLFIIIVIPL